MVGLYIRLSNPNSVQRLEWGCSPSQAILSCNHHLASFGEGLASELLDPQEEGCMDSWIRDK